MKNCEARQYSDQYFCDRCGLQWDVNDPDPPECGGRAYGNKMLKQIMESISSEKSENREMAGGGRKQLSTPVTTKGVD